MPNLPVLDEIEKGELILAIADARDAADRLTVFTAYGWESGEIGVFTDARTEALANLAANATPLITNPAYRYPTPTTPLAPSAGRGAGSEGSPVATELGKVNASQPLATGGSAQAATAFRNEKLVEMESANERVRLYYGSCSDLREKTPELAKIGFQPKRDAGDAQEQPEPGTPGPVTYDPAAETLSVAVMPDHSTTLRAYRQPLGGAPELAGSSPTTTVSVVQFSPLTPGVTYEFWLVGHTQSAGERPQSNHVTHVVPVGP